MDCWISSALATAILREAASSLGREVCGLLFGEGLTVEAIEPCANVAGDPARAFEIDPVALFAAHRRARAGGQTIIGHYHSHPTGDALPSPRDAAASAGDGALWLIVGGGALRAWRAVRGGAVHGRFDPVAIRDASPCADSRESPEGRGCE